MTEEQLKEIRERHAECTAGYIPLKCDVSNLLSHCEDLEEQLRFIHMEADHWHSLYERDHRE